MNINIFCSILYSVIKEKKRVHFNILTIVLKTMKWKLRKCPIDGIYTLKDTCPLCGSKTIVPHPPRFSPEDKFVKYRIEIKKGRKINC